MRWHYFFKPVVLDIMGSTVTQKDIDKQLKEWTNENNKQLTKGPDQEKADKSIHAYRDYLVAKNAAANAPAALLAAKSAYLEDKYGPGYDISQDPDTKAEVSDISETYTQEHTKRIQLAKKAFEMYKAVSNFAANSLDDYKFTLNEHISGVQASESSVQFQTTSRRQTYYLNQERETLENWDTALTLIIVSVGLVYAYHFFYIHRLFKSVLLWFLLLLIFLSSFLLPKIVNWAVHIPQPVNVYSSWAKTNMPEWHGNEM